MATPDFVVSLREKIGTEPLWLAGVTAVVLHDEQVLLVKRADTGAWTPVTGIVDPGEQPADAAVRETLEEADLRVEPLRLAAIGVTAEVVYANGDRAQYLDHTFVMRYLSGVPAPADGENTEARWFALDALPDMAADMWDRLDAALSGETAARFTAGTSGADA